MVMAHYQNKVKAKKKKKIPINKIRNTIKSILETSPNLDHFCSGFTFK